MNLEQDVLLGRDLARRARAGAAAAALLAALLAGAVLLQAAIDSHHPRRRVEKLLYLPSGRFLKPAVLGFDNVAADWLWLRAIGYFGGHYMADRNYPWLAHMLNLITDLDPRFSIVYYFGGIVLAIEAGQVDESIRLLEKGMLNLPHEWKYPFYLGFDHFYYKGDLVKAGDYISRAARLPGHPEYLPRLAASLYAKAGRMEDAIAFLEALSLTVEDERLRMNIWAKIQDLKAGRIPHSLDKVLQSRPGAK